MTLLRDGTTTNDPRLDRLIQFDERSRNFGVAEVLPAAEWKPKTWRLDERNDQRREGACVGFGVSHRLAAAPLERGGIDDAFSLRLYREAQKIDPWEGENYEGTSVLAGIQAAQALGYIKEYRWCFSVQEIILAVAYEGPVVVGTTWDANMFAPQADGFLKMGGGSQGGHCYLIRGVGRKKGRPYFRITNSWGRDWGVRGDAFIWCDEYEQYLLPGGDAVVPYEVRFKS